MSEHAYYFAYGSNMNAPRLRERLVARGGALGERRHATLGGYRLTFDKVSSTQSWVGFANIVPERHSQVEGTINRLSAGALKILDEVEIVPHHYRRHYVVVRDSCSGKKIVAATYIANPQMVRPDLRPTKDYLAHLLAGMDLLSPLYGAMLKAVECWE